MNKLIVFIFLLHGGFLYAQNDSTRNQGEVLTGEIIVEKDKKIILPQADKIFIRSTPRSFGNDPLNQSFNVQEPKFEWPDYKTEVSHQRVNDPYPLTEYDDYIKLGFGNYRSPLMEAGLFQKFGLWDSRVKLFYESFASGPVNDSNSKNAIGMVDLSSTYEKESLSFTPMLSFYSKEYSFFGNTNRFYDGFDSAEPDESRLNHFMLSMAFETGNDGLNFYLKPTFTLTNQDIRPGSSGNNESAIGVSSKLEYEIDETIRLGADINGNTASYDGGIEYDRSLININSWIGYSGENFKTRAGFVIASSSVDGSSKTGFYPKANVSYELSNDWSVYAKISGGFSWNSLEGVLDQNEFMDDSLGILSTENEFSFGGEVRGNPISTLHLDVSLTHSSLNGLPFYIPSFGDSARYTLTYDAETVAVTTLRSNVSFMPTSSSMYGASLEINGYSVESLDKPWHKPAYIFKAYTSHNIQEKFIASAYLTSMGGIRAPANVDFGYLKLKAFTDVGIGLKYLINERSSVFIDVNNLLNNEYERYLGYPTRGLAFKIGGQYRF